MAGQTTLGRIAQLKEAGAANDQRLGGLGIYDLPWFRFRRFTDKVAELEGPAVIVAYRPAQTEDPTQLAEVHELTRDQIVCVFDAFVVMGFQRSDTENTEIRHTFGASKIMAMNRMPRSYSFTFQVELSDNQPNLRGTVENNQFGYPAHGVKAWMHAYDKYFRAARLGAARNEDKLVLAVYIRDRIIHGAFVSTTVTVGADQPQMGICSGLLHVTSDTRNLRGAQPGASLGTPPLPWSSRELRLAWREATEEAREIANDVRRALHGIR